MVARFIVSTIDVTAHNTNRSSAHIIIFCVPKDHEKLIDDVSMLAANICAAASEDTRRHV